MEEEEEEGWRREEKRARPLAIGINLDLRVSVQPSLVANLVGFLNPISPVSNVCASHLFAISSAAGCRAQVIVCRRQKTYAPRSSPSSSSPLPPRPSDIAQRPTSSVLARPSLSARRTRKAARRSHTGKYDTSRSVLQSSSPDPARAFRYVRTRPLSLASSAGKCPAPPAGVVLLSHPHPPRPQRRMAINVISGFLQSTDPSTPPARARSPGLSPTTCTPRQVSLKSPPDKFPLPARIISDLAVSGRTRGVQRTPRSHPLARRRAPSSVSPDLPPDLA